MAFNLNGTQGGYVSIQEEVVFQGKHGFSGMEFLEEIDMLPPEQGGGAHLFAGQIQQQQHAPKFDNLMVEDFGFDSVPQPTQPFQETAGLKYQGVASSEPVECYKQTPPSSSLASLELLSNYGSRFKRLSGHNRSNLSNMETSSVGYQKLSAEDILRVAGARYVQFSAHWNHNIVMPLHPYGFALGGLSEEETRDVELAQFLLAAAERVDSQQFERASSLLLHCQWNSSAHATPVQRVIFHFAQALRERIDKETGRMAPKWSDQHEEYELLQNLDPNIAITCHQTMPFNQVLQFAAIQAIVENVATETKIHMIDLEIRSGVRWTILMQTLAERKERPIERLKITAIGFTTGIDKLEATGKWLASFAESLNLPFSYKAVFVADILEIKEDRFEIEDDEVIAVYSPFVLKHMISRPDRLENLMGVVRNIKPSIMVVLETEANHNSPSFVNRFIEALFFYSAYFDCMETCVKQEIQCRMKLEEIISERIRNIVAMEGRERTVRNVKIDVWRRFFARYRMVEIGFSESSMHQANLVAKKFACGNSCTLDNNGKSLTVGWKGTPIHAVSAWRFL